MKIVSINNYSFTANPNKKDNKTYLLYPIAQGLGATIGFNISEVVAKPDTINSTNTLNTVKTNSTKKMVQVANKFKKNNWKNALIGAFIGTVVAMITDICINNNKAKS